MSAMSCTREYWWLCLQGDGGEKLLKRLRSGGACKKPKEGIRKGVVGSGRDVDSYSSSEQDKEDDDSGGAETIQCNCSKGCRNKYCVCVRAGYACARLSLLLGGAPSLWRRTEPREGLRMLERSPALSAYFPLSQETMLVG